eukprot:g12936.t1
MRDVHLTAIGFGTLERPREGSGRGPSRGLGRGPGEEGLGKGPGEISGRVRERARPKPREGFASGEGPGEASGEGRLSEEGGYEQTETDMVYGFLEQWWSPKSAEVVLQLAIFVFFATFCFGAGWLVLLQLEMRQIREDYGITSSTRAESLRSFFAAHFDYARGPVYGVYWLFAGVLFSVVSFCATLVGGFLLNFLGSMLAVAIGVLCAVYILFTTMGRTDKAFFAWLREDVCGGRTLGDGVRFVYARCLSSPLLQLLSLSGSRGREPGTAEGQPSDPVYAGREEVGPAGLPASDYYLCEEEIRLEEQRLALEHVKLRYS